MKYISVNERVAFLIARLRKYFNFIVNSFGVVKFCRWEGKKDWERRVKNGVRMKHMISVDYTGFSFS